MTAIKYSRPDRGFTLIEFPGRVLQMLSSNCSTSGVVRVNVGEQRVTKADYRFADGDVGSLTPADSHRLIRPNS
jgi:hypothetical protein